MAGKSGGLGKKGLDSVFGGKKEMPVITKGDGVQEITVKTLEPNPYQPRKIFDPEKMQELIDSIRNSGVIQPLIVRKKGRRYEIVAGERRWRAATEVGLKKVPVIIKDYDDAKMKEVALVENIQRSNLDPFEEAMGIKNMMDDLGISQAEVATRLGKSRSAIANSLRILNLPKDVKKLVSDGKMSVGQIRPLLALDKAEDVSRIAKKAAEGEWNARMVEEFIASEREGKTAKFYLEKTNVVDDDDEPKVEIPKKAAPEKKKAKPEPVPADVYTQDFEGQLRDYLGTKVSINPNKNANTGGKIVIEYYSPDDLERVYELLQKQSQKNLNLNPGPSKFHV